VDLHETKDRIAVALVESIFRRARYPIRAFRPEARGATLSREDLAPSFWVTVPASAGGPGRELLVDVSYRPFVGPFIALEAQRRESSVFLLARRHWPTLRFVLVTDHPEPGRSCFQCVVVGPGAHLGTVDLAKMEEFGIFAHNVADHEDLLFRIVAMLGNDRRRPQSRAAGA
jgi:hypothetical protein